VKKFLAISLFFLVFGACAAWSEDLTWNTHKFPNGFTLVTKEVHSHPSCSVHLFVGTGSTNEDPRINGISHFYEHIFFKGTKRRTSTQMKSEIEDYGGDLNGATYRDYTEFIVDIPSVYVDKAIDLLMDAFQNATLDPIELEKERKVVLDEVSLDAANPQRRLSDLFQKAIYTTHPYRFPIAGSPESVKRITRDDLLEWKKKFYVPANAYLIVVGDIDTKTIEQQVEKCFNSDVAETFTPLVFTAEPPKSHPVIQETNEQVNQAFFELGYLVAGLDTPDDIYPLDVLTFMLGYGRSSILTRELKDSLHLATNATADFLTQKYPSTLQIEVVSTPEQVEPCKKRILDIITRIRKGDIDPSEIERAKTLLEGVYTLGNQTNSGKVSTIGFYVSMGAGSFAESYLSHIRKVTKEDIMRVSQKYLQDNYVMTVFLPESSHPNPKTP